MIHPDRFCPPARQRTGEIPTIRSLSYHLHTLLLFTYDQLFDIVIPGAIFGLSASLSGPTLSLPPQAPLTVFLRAPIVCAWLWLLILQFCLQNQCNEASLEEDAINKPWRPLPSHRITLADAKWLLMTAHLTAGVVSWYLGVSYPFLIWTALATLHNEYGGGDCSGFVRNIFCGAFFTCSFGGALTIALGDGELSDEAKRWTFLVCCCIVLTTIQTQEFRDEAGDRARGRKTLVTELGRVRALWTVHIAVIFWSLYVFFRHHS
jgi:4-hydroxybenzoate polyprenyltransferase